MTDYPKAQIAGVILAGGRAERMGGRDKGLLPLAGRPMAAYALAALAPQVGTVIINANRNLDDYRALGVPVVSDAVGEFYGPLAGMLAALAGVAQPYIITSPCDSPLLAADYVSRMYTALIENDAEIAVAQSEGRLQPVFALLSTAVHDSLRAYLLAGERKIDRWFACHRLAVVDFADRAAMFRNVNTPEELAALEQELSS